MASEEASPPVEVPGAMPMAPGPLAPGTQAPKTGDEVQVAQMPSTGPVSNPLALRHERLQGTISKYVMSSGTGFVKSHLFEGELSFKTESIMLECQSYEFKEGEGVEFDVQSDDRGRPHAVTLKPIVGRKPTDCLGQRHRGYVRRFADRWGFLNAAAFDGDLFVHRDNLLLAPEQLQEGQPPLRTGQAVEFDVACDERGRTVAKQITTSSILRPCDWIGRRLQGVIRSFQGAWGFVNCDKFAGDLFLHRDALLQHSDADLTSGTIVEFDVERDHHKKGGKNRLVARQVQIMSQMPPQAYAAGYPGGMPPQPMMHAAPPMDPMAAYHAGMANGAMYGAPMGPQAQPFAPQPMYYGAPPPLPDQYYGQPPPPYGYDPYAAQAVMQAAPPPMPHQAPMPPQFVQPPVQPQPPAGQQFQAPYAQAPMPGAAPANGAPAQPQPDGSGAAADAPQVLLHITTHDWEPDQAGQLRVAKGTLVNVSHRAAHGWVYAATVKHGEQANEPPSEGWVPQAVAKRVSLCRVGADWPEEGAGTLGLLKGDLIAVSKEAERGWVYGERVSPKREDKPADGWLPKKVLEYILT